MPQKKLCVETLELEAIQHVADAQEALERTDIGEMDAQIEQSRHMEQYCNKMLQVATLKGEEKLIKTMGEQAAKWATATRAATTKRKNDVVPVLVELVEEGASFSEALKRLREREQDD